MTQPNNDLPPLVSITKSGKYKLKLVRPKDEKLLERFKTNKSGYSSCRLFFLSPEGLCMTKNYSAQYPKGLAMLIGKLTKEFLAEPASNISIDDLIEYCSPAFGKKAEFELDVSEDGEWQGKKQYKYKIVSIKPLNDDSVQQTKNDQDVPF